MFKQIVDVQGMNTALDTIRNSEAAIREAMNEWGPQIIEGVLAGDTIAHANLLLNSITGVRRTRLSKVMRKFLPFKVDAETGNFTQKDKQKEKKCVAAFEAFLESDDTLYGLVNDERVKEKADKSPEEKRAAARRAFEKATTACLETGVSLDVLMGILSLAAAEAHAEAA